MGTHAISTETRRRGTDETTPNEQKQRRKGGYFVCATSSHIVHISGAFRRSKAGYSGQVPHCIPNGLYLSLFRLIEQVL